MFRRELFAISIFIFAFPVSRQKDLPKYIQKCSMKHNLKECVLKSGNNAIPYIVKGDPAYHVPNMLPLHIPFISLISTPELSLNLTDLMVYGLDHTELIDFIPNTDNIFFFTVVFTIPNVTVAGQYSVNGKVMVMPIEGKGKFSMILNNGVYKYTNSMKTIEINGEKYYQTDEERLTFQFQKISFDLGNLFNGDEKLGAQINKFLNENWDALLSDFGPGVSATITGIIKQIFNGIAKDVPAKNIFLPD